jgi:flagellar protein FliL
MAAKKKKKGKDDEEKKPLAKKLMPLLVLLGAAAAYKFVLAPKPAPSDAATDGEVAAADVEIPEGPVVTLPEQVLNLAGDENHYLRVGVALILEEGTSAEAMTEELPIASDVVVDVMSAKTPDELREPDAKTAVKEELSEKVREAYHDEKVARVIFTTFVMQ